MKTSPQALQRAAHTLRPPQRRHSSTAISPRWLSELPPRIGKCLTFGTSPAQTEEASSILDLVARDWRTLLAGSEGFLTSPSRRGLYRQAVVWGDMDSMGTRRLLLPSHVNNVVYNKWAESGRALWAQKYATHIDPARAAAWNETWTPRGQGLILGRITTEFKFPMTFPDRVTVYHRLAARPEPGADAFSLDVLVLSEKWRRAAARCKEDIVMYDYRLGRKVELPGFMREAYDETWELQETARRENVARVEEVLGRVRALEEGTWDREGAVEDTGTNA